MSVISAALIRPVPEFPHTRFRCSTQIPFFRTDFLSRQSVRWVGRTLKSTTMTGPVVPQVDADGEDREVPLSSLEQEPMINGPIVASGLGLGATLNNLSKWLFAVLFGITVLWTHDAQTLWASIGSVLNSLLSHILKRLLNQRRPVPTSRSDPGMPSSHAQSIFYIVTFTIITVVQSFGMNGLTAALSGLICALSCYFSWLRISEKLHTTNQVLVGAAIGLGFSLFWFWLWNAIVLKAFESFFWVRIVVVLAAAGLCTGFLVYVIKYWVLHSEL